MAKKRSGMKKGGPFEREIATELSYWWTNDERDDVIWRTQGSGGRAKTRAIQGLETRYQYGDLAPTDPIAYPLFEYFLMECKRGYTEAIDVLQILDVLPHRKDKSIILQWWDEAEVDKELGQRKEILIIFRRDAHLPCVAMSSDFFYKLEPWCGHYPYPHQQIYSKKYNIVIALFSDFFTYFESENLAFLS